MPFKVIQIYEAGRTKLWTVPSGWERNNEVAKKNSSKLVKDENSIPGPEWLRKNCIVKRSNIATYDEAENEVFNMTFHSDTEEDGDASELIRDVRELQKDQRRNNCLNNSMVQEVIYNQENINPSTSFLLEHSSRHHSIIYNNNIQTIDSVKAPTTADSQLPPVYEYQSYIVAEDQNLHNMNNNNQQFKSNLKQVLDNQNQLLVNQAQILEYLKSNHETQNNLMNNQKKIVHKLAGLSMQLEDVMIQMDSHNGNVTYLSDVSALENTRFKLKPIENINELEEMEKLLSEDDSRKKLRNTYSIVCSGGKALDCAYMLADILFSREFLCLCSWSGSTRGEGTKISLKCYKNIITFFWEMIKSWDNNYSLKDNQNFFKNILKNSKKIINAKKERASTSRHRSKKLEPTNVNLNEKKENEDDSVMNPDVEEEITEKENNNDIIEVPESSPENSEAKRHEEITDRIDHDSADLHNRAIFKNNNENIDLRSEAGPSNIQLKDKHSEEKGDEQETNNVKLSNLENDEHEHMINEINGQENVEEVRERVNNSDNDVIQPPNNQEYNEEKRAHDNITDCGGDEAALCNKSNLKKVYKRKIDEMKRFQTGQKKKMRKMNKKLV